MLAWSNSSGSHSVQENLELQVAKKIPFCARELGVSGGKAGAEMVPPCLDGFLGWIAMVAMRRDSLESML